MTVGVYLVAADKPAVVAEPFLDAAIFEELESYRSLAYTAGADERDWTPGVDEANCLLDKLVAPNDVSRGRWRRLSVVSDIPSVSGVDKKV